MIAMDIQLYESFCDVESGERVDVKIEDERFRLGVVREIIAQTTSYIVYLDNTGQSHFATTLARYPKGFNTFWTAFDRCRFAPRMHLLADEITTWDKRLGNNLSLALDGHPTEALSSLNDMFDELKRLGIERVRRDYIRAVLLSSAAIALLTIALLTAQQTIEVFSELAEMKSLMVAIWGGLIGGILSVLTENHDKLPIHAFTRSSDAAFQGRLRMLIAICAGVLLSLLTQSGFIASSAINAENESIMSFLIACAGGFSERRAIALMGDLGRWKELPTESDQEQSPPNNSANEDRREEA